MKISLNTQIFFGAILGVIFGILLGHSNLPSHTSIKFLSGFELLGKFFITLLKIIMIPLVFTSITAGIANLQKSNHAKRIWPAFLIYSLTTTSLAGIAGLWAMNVIKPGVGLDVHLFKDKMDHFQVHTLNLVEFIHAFMSPNNILTVVFAAVLLGITLVVLGERSKNALRLINQAFEIIMTLVQWIMRLAPLGIMGLLTKLIADANLPLIYVLSKYIFLVLGTTLFHGIITLPLILWLTTRISPQKFFLGMKEALITAFSTSSSTATLPVSLRCITENLKVDKDIARFVLPIGSTLNMDGTVLYEAMAALFVANLCGAHLTLAAEIIVVLTAMVASIGAPGIPSAGMVTMILVLQSVGLPAQAVAILIAVDRPLDTLRTVVNVEGDCIGACVVQKFST